MAEWRLQAVCPHGFTETIRADPERGGWFFPKVCAHLQRSREEADERKAKSDKRLERSFRRQLKRL